MSLKRVLLCMRGSLRVRQRGKLLVEVRSSFPKLEQTIAESIETYKARFCSFYYCKNFTKSVHIFSVYSSAPNQTETEKSRSGNEM